jgi:CRISPR-associated endonuclease/helicase Cas3
VIERRTCRSKLVELREAERPEFATVAAAAARDFLRQPDVCVVGVIVNRVQTARDIFNRLRSDQKLETFLLTGRIRPVDRESLLTQVLSRCHATRKRDQTARRTVIVATQTIEVGANLDFDCMVTESAPLPALKQRFGRLNRLGLRESAEAVILHSAPDKAVADKADPIYGEALAAHWKWLRQLEKKLPKPKRKRGELTPRAPRIDFASEVFPRLAALADGEPPVPERHAPCFLEAHARLLAHTSPPPEPQPDISVWLHGVDSAPAEVYVAWRADFTESNRAAWPELAAMMPPCPDELMSLPYGSFRRWMAGTTATIADVEGETDRGWRAQPNAPVLRWDADEPAVITAAQVRPGDTVILPATFGGCDQFGFDPESGPVSDVAEATNAARLAAIGRKGLLQLRLHPALMSPDLALELRQLMEQVEAGEDAVGEAACALARKCFAETPHADLRTAVVQLDPEQLVAWPWYPGHPSDGLLLEFEVNCFVRGKAAKARGRTGRIILLQDHSQRVAERARTYAEHCGLPKPLQRALELGGLGHDLGKAAPPFQRMLRGEEVERAAGTQLAKSLPGVYAMPPEVWRGWRHEALSAALLGTVDARRFAGGDWELVRWLAGASHGRGRPFFAADGDRPEESVTVAFDNVQLAGSTRHGLDRLDSGWVELFHRLNRRYGWWGLARLEGILRLADQQISAEETQ